MSRRRGGLSDHGQDDSGAQQTNANDALNATQTEFAFQYFTPEGQK